MKNIKVKKQYILILLALCSILNYPNISLGANVEDPLVQTVGGKRIVLLPDKLLAVVSQKYPGYRIPNDSDLFEYWEFEYKKGLFPWVVWGDFNGDGLVDVALMLVNDNSWKVIIFNKTSTSYDVGLDAFGNVFDHGDGVISKPSNYYVHLIEKGDQIRLVTHPNGVPDETQFTATYDSVAVGVYESEMSIAYWDQSGYKILTIPNY